MLAVDVTLNTPQGLGRPWHLRVDWSDRLFARLEATAGIAGAAITTQLPLREEPSLSTLARITSYNVCYTKLLRCTLR